MEALVAQTYHQSAPEGGIIKPRANRRGELVVPDWFTQFALDGKLFELSNPAKGTALALGGTSYSDTAPAFTIDVPAGTTLIPVEVDMRQGGTVAGGAITVLLTADNKLRYASGGTAIVPKNNRSDAPQSSLCTCYYGTTAAAITADAVGIHRTFWASLLSPDVSPTADVNFPAVDSKVEWSAKQFVPPVLVGPASFVIYAFAGTTQPSWFFRIVWAELASGQAV